MVFGFIFLFRWFLGLLGHVLCYVTFLKIPFFLRGNFLHFMIFLGIFFQKRAIQWFPHGEIVDSFFKITF